MTISPPRVIASAQDISVPEWRERLVYSRSGSRASRLVVTPMFEAKETPSLRSVRPYRAT
jgi:hypothetical protein